MVVHPLEPSLDLEQLDLPLDEIHRGIHDGLERGRAARFDQRVGIFARWQRRDPHSHAMAQQLVACAERGAQPGLIAVVEENGGGSVSLEQRGLLRRECRAERSHDVLHAGEHEPQDIEVALDQDDRLLLPDRALRLMQVVELASLVKDRVLGRVEILGLTGAEQPSAESHRASAKIVNREE